MSVARAQDHGRTARAKHLDRRTTSQKDAPREAGRQVMRQWKLVQALRRARQGLTIAELGSALEERCTLRTLYRDLAQLEAVGFAVVKEEGRYRLLENAGAPGLPVTPEDVLALRFAEELVAPIGPAWVAAWLAGLRRKASVALTPVGRAFCEEAQGTALVSVPGGARPGRDGALVDALDDAIQRMHRVRIRHASPGKEASYRVVEPRALWYTGGALYLVAQLAEGREGRKFAVARISEVVLLDEEFEPDASFDPGAYARASFGVWHGPVVHAVVDFAEGVAHLFAEREFHPSQRVTALGAGGVRVELDVAGTAEVARWLAGFGGDARVVEPGELAREVERLHRAGLREGSPPRAR
jgi:predicted DNA-binding transcriptional regulator YafY